MSDLKESQTQIDEETSLKSISCGEIGEVLLFIPGWTMPAEIWSEQLKKFGKEFRAISLAMRSHFGSTVTKDGNTAVQYARDIEAFLKKQNIEKCHIVGWSMGVVFIFEYLKEFGEDRLESISFVDGSRFGRQSEQWPSGIDASRYAELANKLQKDRVQGSRDFVRGMFRMKHSEDYLDQIAKMSRHVPTETAVSLLEQSIDTDYRELIPTIRTRTLIMVCDKNRVAAEWTVSQIEHSRAKIFKENTGHAIFVDQPDEFYAELKGFIEC